MKPHPVVFSLVLLICVAPTRGADDASAVVLCQGEFPVRQSACDRVPANQKDVVLAETFSCTQIMTPADMSRLISTDSSSLKSFPVGQTQIDVMFSDCAHSSALPALDQAVSYVAVILLDNNAALESAELKKMGGDAPDKVTMMSNVYFYDVALLSESDFTSSLASALRACSGKTSVCILPYNSFVISKPAIVEIPAYLS